MSRYFKYSQPTGAEFSLDSILFSARVAAQIKDQKRASDFRVLDLCAGCGVVGFELHFALPDIKSIDFMEIQPEYKEHFETNKEALGNQLEFSFKCLNFEEIINLKNPVQYDLILSNPPYFEMSQGKLPFDTIRTRSRFFVDSNFQNLIRVLVISLKKNGEAFFLVRPMQDHKIDRLAEIDKVCQEYCSWQVLDCIRGTQLIYIKKTSEA